MRQADLTKQERKAKKSSNSSGGWFGGGKKQKDASADAARISVATVPVQDKEAVVAAHAKLKVAGEGIREVKDTVWPAQRTARSRGVPASVLAHWSYVCRCHGYALACATFGARQKC